MFVNQPVIQRKTWLVEKFNGINVSIQHEYANNITVDTAIDNQSLAFDISCHNNWWFHDVYCTVKL